MRRQRSFMFGIMAVLALSVVMAGCSGSKAKNSSSPSQTESANPSATSSSSESAGNVDTSEPITLKYYLIGDEQKDSKAVWDEINKKLKAEINTTIEPVIIPWADVPQKYPLIFASGEDFDMVWTGNWQNYADIASKGGFMEITDEMIDKYVPKAKDELPAASFKQARVGGKLYMIPFAEKTSDNETVMIRGDLREKYNLPPINGLQDLLNYCEAIVKNEKGIIPIADEGPNNKDFANAVLMNMNHWLPVSGTPNLAFDFTDDNPTIFSMYDKPEFLAFENQMQEYKKKGYFSKSALTTNSPRAQEFKAGRGAVAFGNLNDMVAMYQEVNNTHPEWKLELANADWGGKIAAQPSIVHGTAIHAGSKHADRVLMAVQLLSFNEDYNRLVNYGILDKNYKVTADNAYQPLNSDYVGTNYSAWAFRGKYLLKPAGAFPNYDEVLKYQIDNMVTSPLVAFSLVTTDIKPELATANDIASSKVNVLTYGPARSPEDTKKAIDDIVAAMKKVGSDKVISETENQVKQYLEDYNK
ncbi:extracellular solute-binding protein [Cohnella endophytica]|uniref:Extracellular solute-binding protein n=1 Tax=Cohnella endophytica TaxID=2419778 RepID=A0A494XXJ5_9BACL|nr:extracellular solute-binding protein [Cohnella endophytica]RKP54444.1 extracellular solute-binding protein [Cohnella endophytica]